MYVSLMTIVVKVMLSYFEVGGVRNFDGQSQVNVVSTVNMYLGPSMVTLER